MSQRLALRVSSQLVARGASTSRVTPASAYLPETSELRVEADAAADNELHARWAAGVTREVDAPRATS